MNAPEPKLNNERWVAKQYKTPSNLNARIQLHQRFSTNSHRWTHWIFDLLRLTPGMAVLEVGGGSGLLWEENRHHLSAQVAITFTDQSAGMVARAFATLGDLPHLRFGVADAQALPFAAGAFDVVIANHMLYHVPDRQQALSEIRRVLKPTGRFFAATNDTPHMQEMHELAKAFLPNAAMLISSNGRFPFDVATRELSQHFGQIQLHRYHNRLVVTDADALADYMLSGMTMELPAIAQAPFRQWLQKQIQNEGVIKITSASGLFEGTTAL
jgi:ubiquinone/menaquinone biosynthesis C-methylase UbiE